MCRSSGPQGHPDLPLPWKALNSCSRTPLFGASISRALRQQAPSLPTCCQHWVAGCAEHWHCGSQKQQMAEPAEWLRVVAVSWKSFKRAEQSWAISLSGWHTSMSGRHTGLHTHEHHLLPSLHRQPLKVKLLSVQALQTTSGALRDILWDSGFCRPCCGHCSARPRPRNLPEVLVPPSRFC